MTIRCGIDFLWSFDVLTKYHLAASVDTLSNLQPHVKNCIFVNDQKKKQKYNNKIPPKQLKYMRF